METTGGDVYWINGKNERHNIRIHNMIKEGLFNSNQQAIKWLCAEETSAEVHRCKIHSALDNTSPKFACYGKKPSINEHRTFGCNIYPIKSSPKK